MAKDKKSRYKKYTFSPIQFRIKNKFKIQLYSSSSMLVSAGRRHLDSGVVVDHEEEDVDEGDHFYFKIREGAGKEFV